MHLPLQNVHVFHPATFLVNQNKIKCCKKVSVTNFSVEASKLIFPLMALLTNVCSVKLPL